MENPFKNIVVNLHATGPAAVLIVWIGGITMLGLYGNGDLAKIALVGLETCGGAILLGLAARS
jgi:hypothetical protein